MKKIILIIFTSLILIGCARPNANYRPDVVSVSMPDLNAIVKVAVGDILVRQGSFTEYDSFYLEEDFRFGFLNMIAFTRGYYQRVGTHKRGNFFIPEPSSAGGKIINNGVSSILLINGKDSVCIVGFDGSTNCNEMVGKIKRMKRISERDTSFQQSLIYSGIVGDKINISYRETSNSFARPAFNNEVEYDLSQSKTIRYKGAVLEIIEADNEYLKYRLISNFRDAGLNTGPNR